jgi:hypothetical protein
VCEYPIFLTCLRNWHQSWALGFVEGTRDMKMNGIIFSFKYSLGRNRYQEEQNTRLYQLKTGDFRRNKSEVNTKGTALESSVKDLSMSALSDAMVSLLLFLWSLNTVVCHNLFWKEECNYFVCRKIDGTWDHQASQISQPHRSKYLRLFSVICGI